MVREAIAWHISITKRTKSTGPAANWSNVVPGKVSGQPLVRGTRILPAPVVRSFDRGESIEQIREDWPSLSVDQIKRLVAFARAQRGLPVP
jgi:uncharacterized protein (DUF433 family)